MAHRMRRSGGLKRWGLALAGLFGLGSGAWGTVTASAEESLRDPTLPPPSIASPQSVQTPAGPVLQSVILSPLGKAAIISGETVRLGGVYGDAKLVKISESEVVLQSGDGLQTLKLYPDVEKRMITPPAAKRGKSPAAKPGTPAGREKNP